MKNKMYMISEGAKRTYWITENIKELIKFWGKTNIDPGPLDSIRIERLPDDYLVFNTVFSVSSTAQYWIKTLGKGFVCDA
jgi:hypothetical protein